MLQRSWIRGDDQCTSGWHHSPLVSGVFSHRVDQAQSPSWKGPACLRSEHHLEVLKLNPLAWVLPLCHLKELLLQNCSKSWGWRHCYTKNWHGKKCKISSKLQRAEWTVNNHKWTMQFIDTQGLISSLFRKELSDSQPVIVKAMISVLPFCHLLLLS